MKVKEIKEYYIMKNERKKNKGNWKNNKKTNSINEWKLYKRGTVDKGKKKK